MDKEFCSDCFFRMLAHDGFKYGLMDNKGNAVLKTWEHCDHINGNKPIGEIKNCPKNRINAEDLKKELLAEGLPFNKDIAEKLLNLKDWEIIYKVYPKQIIITGAVKKTKAKKPKPPKPRIQSKYKNF